MPDPKRKTNGTNETNATDGRHASPTSPPSHQAGFIPPHGGYEKLLSYPKTQIIYDATVRFCDRFISRRSRTHDQIQDFLREGGLRERMTRARLASRARQQKPGHS